MSVTDEIKSRLDIVQYIQQYVPDLKKAGRQYKACCPFHNEKTPSFVVNPDRQTWRCFGACAEGGDVFSFAMKRNGWDFREALESLGDLVGVEVRQQTPQQKQQYERADHLRGLLQTAAELYHDVLMSNDSEDAHAALYYAIEKRGFSEATLRHFGVGYALPEWQGMLDYLVQLGHKEEDIIEVGLAIRNDKGRVYDRFRNRLVIPICDDRGRVVGFGGRALSNEDNPKYLNSPQTTVFNKSQILFGLDKAKKSISDSGTAVIVEGYMDVIQAHQAGYTNVVAQMGTAMTEAQLQLLAPRYANKIVMALDADAAGQNATMRSLEVARQALRSDYTGKLKVDILVLQIPDAKDPDDLLRESPGLWENLVNDATPVAEFVIDAECSELSPDASSLERETVARRLLPILTASENNFYKEENIQKLALRLRIPERTLLNWSHEQRKIDAARPPTPPPAPEIPNFPPVYGEDLPPEAYDGMDYQIPPEFAHEQRPVPVPPTVQRQVQEHRNTERHCLRMFFQKFESLALVNRKLRELSNGESDAHDVYFREFCIDDFTDTVYRMLMQVLLDALQQDELEPVDYIQKNADAVLFGELEYLQQNERDTIQLPTQKGDLESIWGHYKNYRLVQVDWEIEVLDRALTLRLNRLIRESQDIQFLQTQAQSELDYEQIKQSSVQMFKMTRAKFALEAELKRLRNPMSRAGWFSS